MKKILWLTAALIIIFALLIPQNSTAAPLNTGFKHIPSGDNKIPCAQAEQEIINESLLPVVNEERQGNPKETGLSPGLQINNLGAWHNPLVINYEDITQTPITAELGEKMEGCTIPDVIKINLPSEKVITTAPYDGSFEWHSDAGNNRESTLTASLKLPKSDSILLDYMISYSTQEDCDYGFVEVSTNNGKSWDRLKSYDGESGGWINEILDLSSYSGKKILLQFRYFTDGSVFKEGIYLDRIRLTAGAKTVLSEGAENNPSPWTVSGWTRYPGYDYRENYYLIACTGNEAPSSTQNELNPPQKPNISLWHIDELPGGTPNIQPVTPQPKGITGFAYDYISTMLQPNKAFSSEDNSAEFYNLSSGIKIKVKPQPDNKNIFQIYIYK